MLFPWKRLVFSIDLYSQGCRNGGKNVVVVLVGSRDLWVKTGQNAMWRRVVMRGAGKGVFGGLCGAR